ncbi:conserved oligomeric Golgi complex subunit 1 isoform X2 [Bacillus rossius redtenbacheri]
MEQRDYLMGAQLFLLARHVSTGLQLEGGASEGLLIVEQMPLILQQWDTIGQFRTAILDGCQHSLQSHSLSPEEAASCMSAVVLLEGLGSLELLDRFLELRGDSLEKVLQFDREASVKASLASALELLVHTILLLHACFCDGSDDTQGLVWGKLKSIVGRDALPSVSLVSLKDLAVARFLPPVVREYRPSCSAPLQPVSPGDMRGRATAWLERVGGRVGRQAAALLGLVGTLRGLRGVREAAVAVAPARAGWDEACRRLMVPPGLDPWREYFAPLVTAHAKTLVAGKWAEAVAQLEEMLVAAVRDAAPERCSQPEHDLRWFVWKEWATDLPRDPSSNRGLLMKVVGFTPSVEKLCSALDACLESLIQDLQFYLSPEPEHEQDSAELRLHLQQCSDASVRRLVQFVESRLVSSEDEGSTVLAARFLQALTSLCPSLHKCLVPAAFHREGTGAWQELSGWLRQRSLACWQAWSALVQAELRDATLDLLGPLLDSAPRRLEASVREELEEGRAVSSVIRVPAQPSLALQAALWGAARRLGRACPHAVPLPALRGAVRGLLACVLGHYRACLDEGRVLAQVQALQLLLDVRYLAVLLLPRDDKELTLKLQEISERLEEKIDPFDMNVFSSYLQANIKASVQRSQSLLGVLVAWSEKTLPAPVPAPSHDAGSQGTDPSVVPLCSGAPWFPLLPLAGPPAAAHLPAVTPDKPQPKKLTSTKSKVEASPGDIMRSSAAAFFGAMSSEWFGSS